VFDSLITAGRPNSFQIVGAVKLKERLPKLVVLQKGIDKRFISDWLRGDNATFLEIA